MEFKKMSEASEILASHPEHSLSDKLYAYAVSLENTLKLCQIKIKELEAIINEVKK